MDENALTNNPDEIAVAIEAATKKGPAGVAELAKLCLWRVALRPHPSNSSAGPDGWKPLEHLTHVFTESEPMFRTYSTLIELTKSYPKPGISNHPKIPDSEAASRVQSVLSEADQPDNERRRFYLWCRGLTELAQGGLDKAHLQPLIQLVLDNWTKDTKGAEHASQALIYAGEFSRAKEILATIRFQDFMGPTTWSNCAKILVETGQVEEARRIIDQLWSNRAHFNLDRRDADTEFIAQVYAYLGDLVMARNLVHRSSLESRTVIECLIIWVRYLNGQSIDSSLVMDLSKQAMRIEPPKSRAAEQIGIMKMLLAVGKFSDAWQVLDRVRESLLAIEPWSKLEFRTALAADVLLPYLDQHPAQIFKFVSALMVRKATGVEQSGGIWPMVHVVSGLRFIITRWAGELEIESLKKFLGSGIVADVKSFQQANEESNRPKDGGTSFKQINEEGGLFLKAQEYEKARLHYKQALNVVDQIRGITQGEIAQLWNNYALSCRYCGDNKQARFAYEKSLSYYTPSNALPDIELVVTLSNLGRLALSEGDNDAAWHYLTREMAVYKEQLEWSRKDIDIRKVAWNLHNLAEVFCRRRNFKAALENLEQALDLRRKVLPEGHDDIAENLKMIADVLYTMGENGKAKKYYLQALPLYKRILGPDHELVADIEKQLRIIESN